MLFFDICRCPPKKPVIDAFAGVGGNAIQFAKAGLDVTAIEIDATKCAMLKHNASIYGVEHSIDIICGNCLEWITENEEWINQSEATIFLAPPWGGPNYSMKQVSRVLNLRMKFRNCVLTFGRHSQYRNLA